MLLNETSGILFHLDIQNYTFLEVPILQFTLFFHVVTIIYEGKTNIFSISKY